MEAPQDLLQLYAKYGQVAEKAQLLETEVGNIALGFFALIVGTNKIDEQKKQFYSGLVNTVNRQTLGKLLTDLKKVMEFDETTAEIVDEALVKRNYLTHHFFRDHNFAIFDEVGRTEMLQELTIIEKQFENAYARLSALSSLLAKMSGVNVSDGAAMVEHAQRKNI